MMHSFGKAAIPGSDWLQGGPHPVLPPCPRGAVGVQDLLCISQYTSGITAAHEHRLADTEVNSLFLAVIVRLGQVIGFGLVLKLAFALGLAFALELSFILELC